MGTRRRRTVVILLLVVASGAAGFVFGQRGIPFVGKHTDWSIGIYTGPTPLEVGPPADLSNPVLTAADVTDVRAEFVADPFLFRGRDRWYLFFEVLNADTHQGDVAYATSPDARTWTYGKIVLDEPFHLSYPQVFEWEGETYMLPESSEANSLRLYRAVDFPDEWTLVAEPLPGFHLDPSLFRYRDRWWLYSTTSPKNDYLRLYSADSLTGPWVEHPSSPIVRADPVRSRGAGRVLVQGDRVVRFAQDDKGGYGFGVHAFEVLELTETEYREQEIVGWSALLPTGHGWNAEGMHQIDLHPLDDGSWITPVDGWRTGRRFGTRY